MNWKLEVVVLPVTDPNRSKEFYAEKVDYNLDHDNAAGDHFRVIQLTPPGSGCSIAVGKGLAEGSPGAIPGLQLVVSNVRVARQELFERGVDVSEVQVIGPDGTRPAQEGDELNIAGFCFFDDPDGSSWAVQQMGFRPDLHAQPEGAN